MKFDVRYYLVAILFILFDLEIAFLFPWAIVLKEIGMFGFVSMMIFLAILVVGFIYEWMKGHWNGNRRRTGEGCRHYDPGYHHQLHADGFTVAYDIWPCMLRGRDDAGGCFAL